MTFNTSRPDQTSPGPTPRPPRSGHGCGRWASSRRHRLARSFSPWVPEPSTRFRTRWAGRPTSTPARLTLVLAWVLAECLRHRRPVWPPVPCLLEACLLAAAEPLPPRPELEHQQLRPRADALRCLLHREETPNLERLNRGVEARSSE